jgi:hypothetical protein
MRALLLAALCCVPSAAAADMIVNLGGELSGLTIDLDVTLREGAASDDWTTLDVTGSMSGLGAPQDTVIDPQVHFTTLLPGSQDYAATISWDVGTMYIDGDRQNIEWWHGDSLHDAIAADQFHERSGRIPLTVVPEPSGAGLAMMAMLIACVLQLNLSAAKG